MAANIVLLSDGTGNSSASPFKTNVWRLYQAIDIMPPADDTLPRQIVYYDNGVGTENFKPLAALGGALGIGVWQNVKDLYAFVCRNFQPGDQIYGFGFSRGAFTTRLLMGLIGKCGILKTISEADLTHCVQMAYEAYRRDFLIRASRRRKMIYHHILREPRYDTENGRKKTTIDLGINDCQQLFPDIRFVGVWDTVDAYGMPVDELKIAIDEWVWPMSFADRDPSDRLQTIRHALSLDDARPTFRPVLWNEVLEDRPYPGKEMARRVLSPQRIQQVWFAGAHANVGGGYPDDGLAFTALDWMMEEAASVRLRYDPAARAEIRARSIRRPKSTIPERVSRAITATDRARLQSCATTKRMACKFRRCGFTPKPTIASPRGCETMRQSASAGRSASTASSVLRPTPRRWSRRGISCGGDGSPISRRSP